MNYNITSAIYQNKLHACVNKTVVASDSTLDVIS